MDIDDFMFVNFKLCVVLLSVYYTPQKMFSSLFHLQIWKRPEEVQGRLISHNSLKEWKVIRVSSRVSKFANEKARRNILWGVYSHGLNNLNKQYTNMSGK